MHGRGQLANLGVGGDDRVDGFKKSIVHGIGMSPIVTCPNKAIMVLIFEVSQILFHIYYPTGKVNIHYRMRMLITISRCTLEVMVATVYMSSTRSTAPPMSRCILILS